MPFDDYEDAPVTGTDDTPPEPYLRVEYILSLFRTLRWIPVITPRALGRRWNLEPTTVERDATTAHTITKLGPVQREEHQAQSRMALENIARLALTTLHSVSGMPDFGAAIRAIELGAKFAGIRFDEDAAAASDGVKSLPYDELKARAEALLAKDKI